MTFGGPGQPTFAFTDADGTIVSTATANARVIGLDAVASTR